MSNGAEVTATILPVKSVVFHASAGCLDAKYKKFVFFIDGANERRRTESPRIGTDNWHRTLAETVVK